ncbi:hypothetical protein EfmAA242_20920 [Enterococcus faecium]|nr:hypothetical protein EfmAA242_20920 [Enterococcus faecium]
MDQWLEDWRDHLIHWFVPGNTAQQNAAYLICEMFSYYKTQGISLLDKLNEIYAKYGYCLNTLHSFEFEGAAGFTKMQEIMVEFHKGLDMIGGKKVIETLDYQVSNQAYIDYLETALTGLIEQEDRPILVLFTSHDVLQKVYQKMHLSMLEKGREILAQGLNHIIFNIISRLKSLTEWDVLYKLFIM